MLTKTIVAAALSVLFAASPAFTAEHAVAIKDMKFVPADIEVAVGDTVTFTNLDNAPHTATATDGSFDTGRLNKGESASVTVGAAGTFPYICEIHPSMEGSIAAN